MKVFAAAVVSLSLLMSGCTQVPSKSDEFNSDASSLQQPDSTKWDAYNGEAQYHWIDTDGHLRLKAKCLNGNPPHNDCNVASDQYWDVGRIRSKFTQSPEFWTDTYAKIDSTPTSWDAPNWVHEPNCVEADFSENYGWDPTISVVTLHNWCAGRAVSRNCDAGVTLENDYHHFWGHITDDHIDGHVDDLCSARIDASEVGLSSLAGNYTWEIGENPGCQSFGSCAANPPQYVMYVDSVHAYIP
jgi:hypothetical protein